ncbi:glycerophosphodiester phosphodiesterase family protein [Lysinibacter sp. HNR]|uniref:glycerophosphodiester phosphodiesterase family protein n=1 Tax=Lysinibacter sp. HNR TaxID=3031408 RepID=UPI0024351A68|nr:glycerophosphodiester phosphodiesterase family protein [Lysinibacter sp. HNR]WGD37480.1 glycerophosphodiester phosphodiesterase family protein [Lysinibacter sp. HNR]
MKRSFITLFSLLVLILQVIVPSAALANTTVGSLGGALRDNSHCTDTAAEALIKLQRLEGKQEFMTVRHRGDFDAVTPENSLQAFRNSYSYCRPGVETDVRRTADGQLVMFHDTNIGKMMEPTYNPEAGTGPNAALNSLTLGQLKQKNLVTIDRQPTNYKILTLQEFLQDAVDQEAESLLFIEIKSDDDVAQAVREVLAFHQAAPRAKIFDRVVFKFRLSAYPTFELWQDSLKDLPELPRIPLTQVAVSRVIADNVDRRTDIPVPSGMTPSYYGTKTWAESDATADGVLSVEVTMKDSTGFYETTARSGYGDRAPFAKIEQYYAPQDLSERNTREGTMAQLTALVRASNKPLGQFVPIPDWVMWRKNFTEWDKPLPSVAGNATAITPKDAYFQNDSRCCYALQFRIADQGNDPEQNDLRILLPWMEDIGATVLTSDDTDSIDYYFEGRDKLYNIGQVWDGGPLEPAPAAMNSLISSNTNQRFTSPLMMVSISSIQVNDIDGESPGDIYGNVSIRDESSYGTVLFDQSQGNNIPIYPHDYIPLTGPPGTENSNAFNGQALLHGGSISVELWDHDTFSPDDLIAYAQIEIPENTEEVSVTYKTGSGEQHEIPGKGTYTTYGSVTINYSVQRYWTNFVVEKLTVNNIDGESPGDLFGTVRLFQDGRNRLDWLDAIFFDRLSLRHIPVYPGDDVPLVLGQAPGFDSVHLEISLQDYDVISPNDCVAIGSLLLDKTQPIDQITGHELGCSWVDRQNTTTYTTWNASMNRKERLPSQFIPVTDGDGS